MKKVLLLSLLTLFLTAVYSQNKEKTGQKVPSVEVKTLDGTTFNTADFSNDGKPVIICFWATWCKPCIKEHDAINDVYEDWVEETGVKLYSVSIDNSRSSSRVQPFVNGKGWEFNFLLDVNGDFKRAMGVNVPPHTFILNGNNEIVWQHVGYLDGDEEEYIEIVEKIIKGEKIK